MKSNTKAKSYKSEIMQSSEYKKDNQGQGQGQGQAGRDLKFLPVFRANKMCAVAEGAIFGPVAL